MITEKGVWIIFHGASVGKHISLFFLPNMRDSFADIKSQTLRITNQWASRHE